MRGTLGACVAARGGMHGSWGCMAARGVCGSWGACMAAVGACVAAGGHVLQLWGMRGNQWVCGSQGVHGKGGAWLPVACVEYDEIRSMSGRYASYWNAFLSEKKIDEEFVFGSREVTCNTSTSRLRSHSDFFQDTNSYPERRLASFMFLRGWGMVTAGVGCADPFIRARRSTHVVR